MHRISIGVTDAVFADNSIGNFLVGENLLTDLQYSCRHFRLGGSKQILSLRIFRIDNRACRKNNFHGDDGMVRIDRWPATHAARVNGQYTTDGCCVHACGIRSHAAGVRFQHFVNASKCGADIATNPRPVVLDCPAAPVLPHVDQDVVALRLAVQPGSAGPEGRVATLANAISENRRYMVDDLWLYDDLRDIPVGAGIRCVAHPVADTMPHKILVKYLGKVRLKLIRSSSSKLFVDSIERGRHVRTAEACGIWRKELIHVYPRKVIDTVRERYLARGLSDRVPPESETE